MANTSVKTCGVCSNGIGVDGQVCSRCEGGFVLTDAQRAVEADIVALLTGVKPAKGAAAVKPAGPVEMTNAEKVAARKVARQAATAARRAAAKPAGKPAAPDGGQATQARVDREDRAAAKPAPAKPAPAPAGKLTKAERKQANRDLWAQLNALVASGEITRAQHAERWAARTW